MKPGVLPLAGLVALTLVVPARAQESLPAARDLYASASYEEALALLDRLKDADPASQELREIEQYRALCLLALKRQPEAERAIESLVALDPFYRPQESEAAPWIRASFGEVRKRMLPSAAQQHYLEAKTLFGKREYAQAAALLNRVLAMLEDPDLGSIEGNPTLVDLRTLAQGFLELSQAAAARAAPPELPPQAPPPPAGQPAPTGQSAQAGAQAPAGPPATAEPQPPRVYTAADMDVTPPEVVYQRLPAWPQDLRPFAGRARGVIEIVIGEAGLVESATIRESLNRIYDYLLVEAAKTWRYKAAMKGTTPVKYRRMVQVLLPTR